MLVRLLVFVAALTATAAAESMIQTQMKVTGPPPGEPVTIILNRWNGAACVDPGLMKRVPLPADGLITLPKDRGDTCWETDPLAGAAVMARDRAVAYIRGAEFVGREEPVVVEMRPRRIVNVIVHPASKRMADLARDDLANTDWIWNRNLAGLTIRARFLPNDDRVADANCDTLIDFVPGEINLYYGAHGQSLMCGANSAVFVHEVPVLGDAAHELSHRLGLNQLDHSPIPEPEPDNETEPRRFDSGHTTNMPKFGCNNVMWTLSQVLQDQLSPGQSFWMGLACSSFAAHHGPCLRCAERPGAPSPCPSFTVGQDGAESSGCGACIMAEIQRITGATVDTGGHDRFCDRETLRKALRERYQELRHNNGLKLGSRTEREFVERWMAEIHTVLLVESVALLKDEKQRERGAFHLHDLAAQQRSPEKQLYLHYAADKIRFVPGYQPRCELQSANAKSPPDKNAPASAPAAAPAPGKPAAEKQP